MDHKIHQGRNIKRFREMLGIKQEALALDLGEEHLLSFVDEFIQALNLKVLPLYKNSCYEKNYCTLLSV